MRAFEFLIESPQVASLQKALIAKIQQLPADDSTLKALKEIEDLLNAVGAGGRMGMVNNQLEEIGDEDVTKARKLLAKYVLSIDADPADKKAMMDAWKADKLIDIKSLMSPVYHKITDVVIGYRKRFSSCFINIRHNSERNIYSASNKNRKKKICPKAWSE